MNVLVAGSPGRRLDAAAAQAWAQNQGATTTSELTDHGAAPANGGFAFLMSSNTSATSTHLAPPGSYEAIATPAGLTVRSGRSQRLFLHRSDAGLLVSSHLGALACALRADDALDRSYEDFLLGFGFLPDDRTLLRDVVAVPGGSTINVTSDTTTNPSPAPSIVAEPHDDLAELICEVLDEQAGSSRTVGVLLGGFDSALVAAALGRTGREVHTFTFTYDEPGFAQRNVEAAVSAAGAIHHDVKFTPEILGEALVNLPARLNQPSPQPHYQLQTIIAAEAAAAAGAEMVFTGDGCDALFAAYPTINTRAAAGGFLERIPQPARSALLRGLSHRRAERSLGHVARVGRSALRASMLGGEAARHLPTQYLDEIALGRLRRDAAPDQAETIEAIRRRLAAASGLTDPVRLAFDGNALTGQSSSKVEGAVTSSGLAIVTPFTHPRFRAAVAALPEDRQRPDGKLAKAEGKPALQEAADAAGLLPRDVIYQPKQAPTESPIDRWYSGPLRSTVDELFTHLPFETNLSYIDELLRPKRSEELYRQKVAISQHAFQAIGLLSSYASFCRLAR